MAEALISANVAMTGWYDYRLVVLSVLLAISASYAALDSAARVTAARGWARSLWLIGGATAMGFGIWSMHFTGMHAFNLPIPVHYYWPTVLVSLLVAVASSGFALYAVAWHETGHLRSLVGSVLMGSGIVGLHYIAMAAMRLPAVIQFDLRLVALSVMLAIFFSLVALRLAFYFRVPTRGGASLQKAAGAIFMGAAVSGMHYTAMAAAKFIPTSLQPDLSRAVSFSPVGTAGLATVTLTIEGATVLACLVNRQFEVRWLEMQAHREFSASLLRSQDEERRRIARQLHETTGQSLIAVKMILAKISRSDAARDPTVAEAVSESLALVETCIKEIRTLSHLLHPPLLGEAGLASALRWYAAGFQQRSGIKVKVEVPPDLERFPEKIETGVFRIVQECLTNIHRHSGSPVARIAIVRNEDGLRVEVEDEGRGMSSDVAGQGTPSSLALGVGIAGIRERVKQLGGTMEIHSGKHGTKVVAILPVKGQGSWGESAS